MSKVIGMFTEDKVDKLLDQGMLDKEARRRLASFLEQIDVAIFSANREIIHKSIPDLNRDSFIRFAVIVAEARANYVRLALELAKKGHPGEADVARLRAAREAFDELTHAFEATHRLIKRGYTGIAG